MSKLKLKLAAAAVAVAALAAVLTPLALAHSHAATVTTVSVTAKEFSFKLSKKTVPHGKVTFKVANKGHISHDFKIGGKKTPLIKPGKSATLKVTLKKGKQKYLCTVPGHAASGMKGTLKVT
jgi:uncharacterized cupredoxin-like copper-binding protein